jgi:hypothetical protein
MLTSAGTGTAALCCCSASATPFGSQLCSLAAGPGQPLLAGLQTAWRAALTWLLLCFHQSGNSKLAALLLQQHTVGLVSCSDQTLMLVHGMTGQDWQHVPSCSITAASYLYCA